ncbi:hypothetical protein [Hyphomonas sp.]|uniref:hypothetical protein n=1 Tax=Hyphomonas sp. TaxID=87 RepID=UPI00342F14AE|nr:hypothetical protein [Hyphomonas sp.]
MSIRDAQSRYNLNRLTGGLADITTFNRIVENAGLKPDVSKRIQAGILLAGSLESVDEMSAFGVTVAEIEALSGLVTVLPGDASVNLNTAEPRLVRALISNPAAASRFLALREQDGMISSATLGQIGIVAPIGTGVRTDYLEVQVDVTVGGAHVSLASLITRSPKGVKSTADVIRRQFGN